MTGPRQQQHHQGRRVFDRLPGALTAVVAAFVPLAAALYLATTTIWTFVERLILNRVLGAATSPLEGARD